jgi:CelD/BcsL family acetyltransferase involved in cellulose biosynthesis
LGLVPLSIENETAYFLGNPDVCDYQDIIAVPGQGVRVMAAAIRDLASHNIRQMDMRTLRPDAIALHALQKLATESKITMQSSEEDVTYEMALPDSWEGYLKQLNSKQRHEVRRKIRRLDLHGPYAYTSAAEKGVLEDDIKTFLRLFQLNRTDKATFMNQTMAGYFRDLIQNLADRRMLGLYFLIIDGIAAATVMCFDFNGVRYLYNSGYDAQYHTLSVGILSKVFSIDKGIESGCRYYDFLKGSEVYKKRIGGVKTPLYRCQITVER